MPLDKLPLLEEDYPLFDWGNWQSSREALVQGTPTKYFAKEAWNAIVDGVNNALTTAGLNWDNRYTSVEGAKITAAYGKLTANMINSVRHNIDWPAPLGWGWAKREDFRGYIGREDFRGLSGHGKACDKVYPEYILELVRKMNLLLELMRGTALINEIQTDMNLLVQTECQLCAGISAHVDTSCNASTRIAAEVRTGVGSEIESQTVVHTAVTAEASVGKVGAMDSQVLIPVMVSAEGTGKPSVAMDPRNQKIFSVVDAEIDALRFLQLSGSIKVKTSLGADMAASMAHPIETSVFTTAQIEAEAAQSASIHLEAEAKTGSRVEVEVGKRPAAPLSANVRTACQADIAVTVKKTGSIVVLATAATMTCCRIDSAWYPPKWIDGGLWIRQVHSTDQNEQGELVIM